MSEDGIGMTAESADGGWEATAAYVDEFGWVDSPACGIAGLA